MPTVQTLRRARYPKSPGDAIAHNYHVGHDAKAFLRALNPEGRTLFTSAVLNVIVRANPTADHWRDTRPDDLRSADHERLTHKTPHGRKHAPLLPLWSYGINDGAGTEGTMNLRLAPDVVTTLSDLSLTFGIGRDVYLNSILGVHRVPWEGIRPTRFTSLAQCSPYARAAYTLRAWGMGYLTPASYPPINPKEISPHKENVALKRRGRPFGSKNSRHF